MRTTVHEQTKPRDHQTTGHPDRTESSERGTSREPGTPEHHPTYRFDTIPPHAPSSSNAQTAIRIEHVNSTFEKQADQAADAVVENRHVDTTSISGGTGSELLRKELHGAGTSSQQGQPSRTFTRSLAQARTGGGEALPTDTRRLMENRFRQDLSSVRIHRDSRAGALADEINARAFTHGNHVFFGRDTFQPGQREGQRLIAHELAHTLQRPGNTIQRKVTDHSVENTQGVQPANTKDASEKTYWDAKLAESYELMPENFDALTPEERNALLGGAATVLPATPPAKGEKKSTQLVQVPVGSPPKNQALYVRIVPRSAEETDATAKPQLYVTLIGGGTQLVPEEVGAVPSGGDTSSPDVDSRGFRNNDDDFYEKYREETKRLYWWFNTKANTSSGFVKTLKMTTTVKEGETEQKRTSLFIVRYSKGDFMSTSLEFYLQASDTIPVGTPQADSLDKTSQTLKIEALQNDPKDKIGKVDLTGVPQKERASVEYTILRYFEDPKARSTEIDAVIPISDSGDWVNYTLRFDTSASGKVKTTDISVERIGKAQEPQDDPLDVDLDIQRVKEYPASETDPAKLADWIKGRYPGMTITETTTTKIIEQANSQLSRDADTPSWFRDNYGITILDATDLADRLKKTHSVSPDHVVDTKDFEGPELRHLEVSLQQMGANMLSKWKGLNMGRKEANLSSSKQLAGRAYSNGSDYTVVLYDGAFEKEYTFYGGSAGVFATSVSDITHELGHIAEYQQSAAKTKFNAFVKAESIAPFTWYAKDDAGEFFPEAFSLFYSDPEWMKTHHLKLYEWFSEYDKTGTPP